MAWDPQLSILEHEYDVCNMYVNMYVKVQSMFLALFLDSVHFLAAQVMQISVNISFLLLVDFL